MPLLTFSWSEAQRLFKNQFIVLEDALYYNDMMWRGRVHALFTDFSSAIACCQQFAGREHNLMLVSGEDVILDDQMFTAEQARSTFPDSYTVIERYLRQDDGHRRGFLSRICSEESAKQYFDWCGRQGRGSACCTRGQNLICKLTATTLIRGT